MLHSLFLQFLQPLPPGEFPSIDKAKLIESKSLALKHNLFMLWYSQLESYSRNVSSGSTIRDFLKESKPLYLQGVVSSIRQEHVENDLITLLKKNGISSIVIKGNALARELYDDQYCRSSVDIDMLVKREDVFQAESLLKQAGFMGNEKIPLRYYLDRIHHSAYSHKKESLYLEMHWHFGVPYFFNLSSAEIWSEIKVYGDSQLKLSPDMTIIMLLVHHHSHSFRELKILVDLLWAFHKYDRVMEWELFARRLQAIGLVKTALISLMQIKALWTEASERIASVVKLLQEIEQTEVVVPSCLSTYFRMDLEPDSFPSIYKDKFMARLLLDRWSTILESFLKTLFPSPRTIKVLYDDNRNWTLPVNYLRFLNWKVKSWSGSQSG